MQSFVSGVYECVCVLTCVEVSSGAVTHRQVTLKNYRLVRKAHGLAVQLMQLERWASGIG